MDALDPLLENNRAWAFRTGREQPGFFEELAKGQSPSVLWIGCSDSRVPPEQIVDLAPGSLFVHRNIANQVLTADANCQAVVQYAVEALQVKHIIVCGHYGCGGVAAALAGGTHGAIDGWLEPIRQLYQSHFKQLGAISDPQAKKDRLCELNAIEQVASVCRSKPVREAWGQGRELAVHGWMFSLADGLLADLNVTVSHAG